VRIDDYLVILSEAKDLCMWLAAPVKKPVHRSFALLRMTKNEDNIGGPLMRRPPPKADLGTAASAVR